MRAIPIIVVGSLVLLALPMAAQEANPEAPPISTTNAVLFAHHHSSDTVELEGWVNTLSGDGDDTALGPSGSCQTHTGQQAVDEPLLGVVGSAMDRTYTFTVQPAQSGTMRLDPAGKIIATLYVGAGSCFGKLDLTSTLLSGTTKIAESTKTGHWYDNSAALYPQSILSSAPLVTDVPLEGLTWKIRLKGTTGGAAFLGVGPVSTTAPRGTSQVQLPILDVVTASGAVTEDVAGDFNRTHAWAEASNETFLYNWTSPGGEHLLEINGSLASGSVFFHLGNEGKEILNLSVGGDILESLTMLVPEGSWNLTVAAASAVGDVGYAMRLVPPPVNATEGASPNTTLQEAPTTEADGGVPMPGVLVLVGLLAAACMGRRR